MPTSLPLTNLYAESPSSVWAFGVRGTVIHWDGRDWSSRAIDTEGDVILLWSENGTIYAVARRVREDGPCHFDSPYFLHEWRPSGRWREGGRIRGDDPDDVELLLRKQHPPVWAQEGTVPPLKDRGSGPRRFWRLDDTDIWAVADDGRALAHFDGREWHVTSAARDEDLVGVVALEHGTYLLSTDLGYDPNATYPSKPELTSVISRWTGTGWSAVHTLPGKRVRLVPFKSELCAYGRGLRISCGLEAGWHDIPTPDRLWTSHGDATVLIAASVDVGVHTWDGRQWERKPFVRMPATDSTGCIAAWSSPQGTLALATSSALFVYENGRERARRDGVEADCGPIIRYRGPESPYSPRYRLAHITAVWGSSGTDIWAVGYQGVRSSYFEPTALVLHFDGQQWTRADLPRIRSALTGVSGHAGRVWAVGTGGTILQWDGTTWAPQDSGATDDLISVAASAEGVWAVGRHGATLYLRHSGAETKPAPFATPPSAPGLPPRKTKARRR